MCAGPNHLWSTYFINGIGLLCDLPTGYEYQLAINKFYKDTKDDGDDRGFWRHILGQMTLDVSVAEKHWLMAENIKPIFPGEFVQRYTS